MIYRKLIFVLFLFTFQVLKAQENQEISLFYKIGKSKITKEQLLEIKDRIKKLNPKLIYTVKIISSADFIGTENQNYKLAKKRANEIKRLLTNQKNINNIQVINKGEIQTNNLKKEGILKDRKSTILFIPISKPIHFKKIAINQKYILQDINFKPGKAELIKKSFPSLNKLVVFLKEHPSLNILIAGHTCCNAGLLKEKGKKAVALDATHLSTQRAKFIYRYLIHKKIDKNRLKYIGYGFQTPLIYPEKTAEDMRKNKRVEIIITKT